MKLTDHGSTCRFLRECNVPRVSTSEEGLDQCKGAHIPLIENLRVKLKREKVMFQEAFFVIDNRMLVVLAQQCVNLQPETRSNRQLAKAEPVSRLQQQLPFIVFA